MLIQILNDAGRPVPESIVSVASDVAELREIAYVTDAMGWFDVSIPMSGAYVFVVSGPEGNQRIHVHLEASTPKTTLVVGGGARHGRGPAAPSGADDPRPAPGSSDERKSASAGNARDALGSEGWEGA